MLGTRRNLLLKLSIVINVAVLLYAAMQLSVSNAPGVYWVPVTGDGSEKTAEARQYNSGGIKMDNDSKTLIRSEALVQSEPLIRGEEYTSQKTPSTAASTNKTVSSTASIAELLEKKVMPSEPDATNETVFEVIDEDTLSNTTLKRLRGLLGCFDRPYLTETVQRGEFWVLKNYVRADHGQLFCHESITYTTHAGFEFLDNVMPLVERWLAPVSIAIHAPGDDFAPTVNSIRYLRDCLHSDLIKRYVTFHLFFSNKHMPASIPDPRSLLTTYNCTEKPPYQVNSSSTYKTAKNLLYPVNVARNIARDTALTHFILPSDIELYPSRNLVPKFLNMIARNDSLLKNATKPRVFVLSLFEVDAKAQVPSSKTELRTMLSKKTAIPFHKFVCPNCHNIPQGQQWMAASETNEMDIFHVGKRQGSYVHWEPIFIGTHEDPHYDERLSWEGKKDKMTQGYVLCVKDYDFMILNNAFLIHKPGIKHYVKNAKRDNLARKQNSFVKNTIMPELKKLYGTKSGCAL